MNRSINVLKKRFELIKYRHYLVNCSLSFLLVHPESFIYINASILYAYLPIYPP